VRPREATTQAGRTHRDVAGNPPAGSSSGPLGAVELESAPFDLRRMIEATAQPVVAAAGDKGLVLEVKTAEALPEQVIGHAPSVRQVLSALLENAVKFTERGEVVASITAHETGSGRVLVHFEISDTGPGIPAQALDERAAGGLAEARQLVEAMDGRMECASATGLGSTLWFSVPLDLLG
jgi:two-component system, sensor histidine kinase and response regulator